MRVVSGTMIFLEQCKNEGDEPVITTAGDDEVFIAFCRACEVGCNSFTVAYTAGNCSDSRLVAKCKSCGAEQFLSIPYCFNGDEIQE
jgi:hypothetical protein